MLENDMTERQIDLAKKIMKRNLAIHSDWIVLSQTMDTLTRWAKRDAELKSWIMPHLERLSCDRRKSISGRAKKMIGKLGK